LPFSDIIETDVCETKDGVLVVHHDHDLLRTCGVHGFIRDYNLADLPKFLPKIELNFAPEGLTSTTDKENIPTLE
jgi:glycerophosphoryl diester phosphodiesterase